MIIYSEPFDKKILFEMQSHYFGDMVKGVVDVEQRKIALDAEMHSDLETLQKIRNCVDNTKISIETKGIVNSNLVLSSIIVALLIILIVVAIICFK